MKSMVLKKIINCKVLFIMLTSSILLLLSASVCFATDPVGLGTGKHLFIDNYMLDSVTNAKLNVNPPTVKEMVMISENQWERNGITSYSNVFWDPYYNQYRLYYVPIGFGEEPCFNLCLATSDDGINWTKPSLGLVSWGGNTNNNIVIKGQREGTVIIDPNAPASRRYAYLSTSGELLGKLFTSPDGIHFTMDDEVITSHWADSQISTFWDNELEKYIHYFKKPGAYGRSVARAETSSMNEIWPDIENLPIVMSTDDYDASGTDVYTSAAQKYESSKSTYFAFPTIYYHYYDPSRNYLAKSGNDGVIETQLATSRDGITWTRYRTPYVPLQRYEDLDLKIAMVFPGIIYGKDHLYQYFCGYTFTHGDPNARYTLTGRELGGIYRLEQRIDGFISMDFDYSGGTVITEPFTFTGNRLALNVNTSSSGEGRVAILDQNGNEIPGYTLDECRIISGDYNEKMVSWGIENPSFDVSSLNGTAVRLKFNFRGTKLYSFSFPKVTANLSLEAIPTASTEYSSSFSASKAISGDSGEWASYFELNPWIRLDWTNTKVIDKVILYDRVNMTDSANGGTLYFSDGTNIALTGIPNDGTAKEITFPAKTVTWVRFQVSGGSGSSVGLQEIEVYEADIEPTPTPTPTPTPAGVFSQDFNTDPGWASYGNRTSPQNFGFSDTNNCGNGSGEMGGTVVRSSIAWYGDSSIDELSMDRALYTEGKVDIVNSQNGNVMIGWFNPGSDVNMTWPIRDFMGFRTDGANVYIYYGKSNGTYSQSDIVYTCTQGTPITYQFTYDPGQAGGDGIITMYFNGDTANPKTLVVPAADKTIGADYTHFGMCSLYTGGSNAQDVFIDSLKYTHD